MMQKRNDTNDTNNNKQSNENCSSTMNNNTPNWKVFKHDTEAGRLLSRLYGVQSNKEQRNIHYPKLKKGGENLNERIPWNQTKKDDKRRTVRMKVPKVGQGRLQKNENTSLVSSIPRRKTESSCQNTIKENFLLSSNYRPPTKVTSVTVEKERLCELHEYGGGCALPDELMMPKQTLPSDMKRRENMAKEAAKAKQKRRARNGEITETAEVKVPLEHAETDSLVDQIVKEIQERREFQFSMERNGSGDVSRDRIVAEITSRMRTLKVLDAKKAIELGATEM
jgi:hypothetical protein